MKIDKNIYLNPILALFHDLNSITQTGNTHAFFDQMEESLLQHVSLLYSRFGQEGRGIIQRVGTNCPPPLTNQIPGQDAAGKAESRAAQI